MAADWKVRCTRRHVCETPCTTCAAAPSAPAPHYKRVKVQLAMIEELARESAPVTLRIEHEPDGDLMFVATVHTCRVEHLTVGQARALLERTIAKDDRFRGNVVVDALMSTLAETLAALTRAEVGNG